ncbi:gluconate 2-dehydrogenase subunit 3 family protein [Flavobacteriaceae bacterium 3-367]
MDRRKALKNMGLTLGYAVATPTLISIMQSCKEQAVAEWTPSFFSKDEGAIITHLVDIILPKTDTPSASEVQVNIFIDKFVNEVMEAEQQGFMKMAMGKFTDKALQDSGKETIADLGSEDLEPVLAGALKISKEQEKEHKEAIEAFMIAMQESEGAEGGGQLSDEVARYAFADNLRGVTIWGYKTSEYIAEEVLAYLPVPGEYIGCGDVDKLTGGKAWSL